MHRRCIYAPYPDISFTRFPRPTRFHPRFCTPFDLHLDRSSSSIRCRLDKSALRAGVYLKKILIKRSSIAREGGGGEEGEKGKNMAKYSLENSRCID